jgi:hypothetical protein
VLGKPHGLVMHLTCCESRSVSTARCCAAKRRIGVRILLAGKRGDRVDQSFLLKCNRRYIMVALMDTQNWLLLTYKVHPEPAKKRIALWRKLKGMGAVYLQNGVCLLPKTDDHTRRLKIIENEINEMSGESVLLETVALDRAQEDKVVSRFKADRDEEYVEFLDKCKDFEAEIAKETAARHFTYAELEENDIDLKKLQVWLEKIVKLDFYGAPLAAEATERLKASEALLDAYAQRVFEAHEENRTQPSSDG